MKRSKEGKGKSVYLEVGFFLNQDGSIHLASSDKDVSDFHVAINCDPKKKNGHPTLFRRLAKCLKDSGAPFPEFE